LTQAKQIAARALEFLQQWRLTIFLCRLLELLSEFGGSTEKEFASEVANGRFWYDQPLTEAQILALIEARSTTGTGLHRWIDGYLKMRDPRALPVLLDYCQSKDGDDAWALGLLAEYRSPSSKPLFEHLMAQRGPHDCIGAVGLAMLGERKGLDYLMPQKGGHALLRSYYQLVYLLKTGCPLFTDTDLDTLAHIDDHEKSVTTYYEGRYGENESETRTAKFSYAELRALGQLRQVGVRAERD
jgi:hypothetical protein